MRKAALIALALAACTPDNGPLMRPGEECLRCHGGSSGAAEGEGGDHEHATPWSLAGTVYATVDAPANAGVKDARVDVTDAQGFSFQLRTNLAGNFYSAEKVVFPLQVCVERNGSKNCMEGPATSGACNSCHASPPLESAPGRIAAP